MSDHTKTYVWTFEECPTYPVVGDLGQYALAWESAHYTDTNVSRYLWSFGTGDPVRHEVIVTYDGVDANDYMHYRLAVDGDTVAVRIDGRS